MASKKAEPLDITKTGPLTYRQLQAENLNQEANGGDDSISPEFVDMMGRIKASTYPISPNDILRNATQDVQTPLAETKVPWGASMFDEKTADDYSIEHLGDVRAENQPWYAKISAGLAKGAITAGTTFANGTAGLITGAYEAASEGDFSKLWNNEITQAMKEFQEEAETILPNYYTEEEQNTPWYTNIFTANFWGDKFLKNMGFTIGAYYSGRLWMLPFQALNTPQAIQGILGATISAAGEGSIEALNGAEDWAGAKEQEIETWRQREYLKAQQESLNDPDREVFVMQDGQMVNKAYLNMQNKMAKADEAYENAMAQVNADKAKVGNSIFAMNMAILASSDYIQFGKLYGGGRKAAMRQANRLDVTGDFSKYRANYSKAGRAWATVKGTVTEGNEELFQSMAQAIAGDYYTTDIDNTFRATIDPYATQEAMDFMKSVGHGIATTMGDPNSWEEWFIGALTGTLGMPRMRSMTDAHGNRQMPITFDENFISRWREYNEDWQEAQKAAEAANQVANNPNFNALLDGIIADRFYQGQADRALKAGQPETHNAVEEGESNTKKAENTETDENGLYIPKADVFDYKNAKQAQLISNIQTFDRIGKLGDLIEIMKASFSTSDGNLQKIIDITTATDPNTGKRTGPFLTEGGEPMTITDKGKQEMVDRLNKAQNDFLKTIDDYLDIRDKINLQTGGMLSDAQLSHLTFMHSMIKNWQDRAIEMAGDVKSAIRIINPLLQDQRRNAIELRDKKAENSKDWKFYDTQAQRLESVIDALNEAEMMDDTKLGKKLAYRDVNKKTGEIKVYSNDLWNMLTLNMAMLDLNEDRGNPIIDRETQANLMNTLQDLTKVGIGLAQYNDAIERYLKNPEEIEKDRKAATKKVEKAEEERKTTDLKTRLNQAHSLQEFSNILNSETDENTRIQALEELEKGNTEASQLAQEYKQVRDYHNAVSQQLDELNDGTNENVVQDAKELLNQQRGVSENLEQMANANSAIIDNPDAFIETSSDEMVANIRSEAAKALLRTAMDNVNKQWGIVSRFAEPAEADMSKVAQKRNPDGTISYWNIKEDGTQDHSVTGSGMPVTLTTEDLTSNGLEAVNEGETPKDFKISSYDGQDSDGKYQYHANWTNEEGRTVYGQITTNHPLHEMKGVDPNAPQETGSDATPTLPTVETKKETQPQQGEDSKEDPNAVGDFTQEQVDEANRGVNEGNVENPKASQGGKKDYWRPVIPEWDYGTIMSFVTGAKARGADFSQIYEYLEQAGAFEYVNSGKLKPGTKIGFMVDPEWEIKKSELGDAYKGDLSQITIFLIVAEGEDAGQIIGSLDEGGSAGNFEELQSLRDFIDAQYSKTSGTDRVVIKMPNSDGTLSSTDLTTEVNEMMVGRVPYTPKGDEHNLHTVPGVNNSEDETTIQFGVVTNGGAIETNGVIPQKLIRKPASADETPGMLYMLIPNVKGTYSPVAVRVAHFNANEFDITDAAVQNTPVGAALKVALDQLIAVKNLTDEAVDGKYPVQQEAINAAYKAIRPLIYTRDVRIGYAVHNGDRVLTFTLQRRDEHGAQIPGREGKIERMAYLTQAGTQGRIQNSDEVILKQILNALHEFNLPMQVNARMLNQGGYNTTIVNSGILTANLKSATIGSNWFTLKPLDPNNGWTPKETKKFPAMRTWDRGNLPTGNKIFSRTLNKNVWINPANGTIVDEKGDIIYSTDATGTTIKGLTLEQVAELFDADWANTHYGNQRTVAGVMVDNRILTPRGRVLNRTTGKYLTGSAEASALDRIAKSALTTANQSAEDKIANANRVIENVRSREVQGRVLGRNSKSYQIQEGNDETSVVDYDRVHSRIPSSWKSSITQEDQEYLDTAEKGLLSRAKEKKDEFDKYLSTIESRFKEYGVDLSRFKGRKNEEGIVDKVMVAVKDALQGTNSERALRAGNAVDVIVRNFFIPASEKTVEQTQNPDPEIISQEAFEHITQYLERLQEQLERQGITLYTDNIVLYKNFTNADKKTVTRVAGEVDILAKDKDGNIYIFDIKTSSRPFVGEDSWFDKKGKGAMSTKAQYALQLSAYQNLFESMYDTPVEGLGILPFVLTYEGDKVVGIVTPSDNWEAMGKRHLIPIAYSPNVSNLGKGVPNSSTFRARNATNARIVNSVQQAQAQQGERTTSKGYKKGDWIRGERGGLTYEVQIAAVTESGGILYKIGNQMYSLSKEEVDRAHKIGENPAQTKSKQDKDIKPQNGQSQAAQGNKVDFWKNPALQLNPKVQHKTTRLGSHVVAYYYINTDLTPTLYIKGNQSDVNGTIYSVRWDTDKTEWRVQAHLMNGETLNPGTTSSTGETFNVSNEQIQQFVKTAIPENFRKFYESGEAEKLNNASADTNVYDKALKDRFGIEPYTMTKDDYVVGGTEEQSQAQPATTTQTKSTEDWEKDLPIFKGPTDPVITFDDTETHVEIPGMEGQKGYFVIGNNIHYGYLYPIGIINGQPVYVTPVASQSIEEHSNDMSSGETFTTTLYTIHAVFKNGNTVQMAMNVGIEQMGKMIDGIKKGLEGNPERVAKESESKTPLYDPSVPTEVEQAQHDEDSVLLNETPGEEIDINDVLGLGPEEQDFVEEQNPVQEWAGNTAPQKERSYDVSYLSQLYKQLADSKDWESQAIARRVFNVAKQLGLKVVFTDLGTDSQGRKKIGTYSSDNVLYLDHEWFNRPVDREQDKRGHVILHELIHAVTSYVLSDNPAVVKFLAQSRNRQMKQAVSELKAIYNLIANTKELSGHYGITDVHEMVAELSNPKFRQALRNASLWDRIKNAIRSLFMPSYSRMTSTYDAIQDAFDRILDNYDASLYSFYTGKAVGSRSTEHETTGWTREKEADWIGKVLPQTSNPERARVLKNLVRVAKAGPTLWGVLDSSLTTMASNNVSLTDYQDAFNTVLNILFDGEDQTKLFEAATQQYGNKPQSELRYKMARSFRDYAMTKDKGNLNLGLLNAFTEMAAKVSNWKYMKPALNSFYQITNESRVVQDGGNPITPVEENHNLEVPASQWQVLINKGWSEREWNELPIGAKQHALDCIGF